MSIHSLMFGWEYPPLQLGGLGIACQGLVRGLLQNGVNVTLVLPHPHAEESDNIDVRYPKDKKISLQRVPSMLAPYQGSEEYTVQIRSIPKELRGIYGEDMAAAIENFTAASIEMTKDTRPDVVHCHDWMTYEAGVRAASYHCKPLVAHIHATEMDRTYFNPDQWIYDIERRGFHRADRIIAVSNYTKGILIDHYGIDPTKISVVHNGSVDSPHQVCRLESTARPEQHPMVLFLGRLTLQKGPRQFIDMAAKVHAVRPEVQFVIAGDGHMLGELIDYTCQQGLQETVIFAGKVSNTEARKLYSQADCFVMPSLSEPFGLVALEAISHGTPVILSKQSGVGEVIGHSMKVDFWDTDKMADCVLTILREEPLAMQLRSEAPHVLHDLTWSNQARTVRSVYEELNPAIA